MNGIYNLLFRLIDESHETTQVNRFQIIQLAKLRWHNILTK